MQHFNEPTIITIATGLLRAGMQASAAVPTLCRAAVDVGCHKTGERTLDLACQGFIISAAHGRSGLIFYFPKDRTDDVLTL